MDDVTGAAYESKKAALAVALRAGIAIRDARDNAGLTQTDLATRMGISQPALARIEAGRTNITLATLAKVATGLDSVLVLAVGAATVTLEPARPSGRGTVKVVRPGGSGARGAKSGAPRSSGARPEGEQVSSHAS
jgi:DNA-binding XRE family transcriptional regulator